VRVKISGIRANAGAVAAGLRAVAGTEPTSLGAEGPMGRAAAAQRNRMWCHVVFAAMITTSILAQCSPTIQAILQFDRAAIAGGQTWRLFTGNLVHYDWIHWAANVGTFAVLCWIAASQGRGVSGTVLLSAVAVGAGVYTWADGVGTYRGISGVDCALAARGLVMMAARDGVRRGAGWLAILFLVLAKSAYEMATGHVLLPTSAPAGVIVVGVTHVIGLVIGAALEGLHLAHAWRLTRGCRNVLAECRAE
jgi:rhomboid family GlyGly-CTERM serine protease